MSYLLPCLAMASKSTSKAIAIVKATAVATRKAIAAAPACGPSPTKKKKKSGRYKKGARIGARARQREDLEKVAQLKLNAEHLAWERHLHAREDDRSRLVQLVELRCTGITKSALAAQEPPSPRLRPKSELSAPGHIQPLAKESGVSQVNWIVSGPRLRPSFKPALAASGTAAESRRSRDTLKQAREAVERVCVDASWLLDLRPSDLFLLNGSAARIVELCLEGEGVSHAALVTQRRLFESSPITAWALAVFRTALALSPQDSYEMDEIELCAALVPTRSVRMRAWQIQCILVNFIGDTRCTVGLGS